MASVVGQGQHWQASCQWHAERTKVWGFGSRVWMRKLGGWVWFAARDTLALPALEDHWCVMMRTGPSRPEDSRSQFLATLMLV